MPQQIRVLVVDDSVVVRRLVSDVLSSDPDIEVVGTAANGQLALKRLEITPVDVMTLDIEMPELNGIETLTKLRATNKTLPVIMFSTLTEQGASATLDALSAGASDYVTKPANMGSILQSRESVRAQLIPKIKALAGRRVHLAPTPRVAATASAEPVAPATPRKQAPRAPQILAIGCSTGGPEALASVLSKLPADFPLPIVVVQHMPPLFTRLFAERLDRGCALRVSEATTGQPVRTGEVLVAPGDFHMEVVAERGATAVRLQQGPPENFCRPAVDVLFRSVAQVYNGAVLAVVLTGMGSDGAAGAQKIRNLGGEILVQDAATSVVWGMPGAIAQRGLADAVLPLPAIANAVVARARAATGRGVA